MKKVLLRFYDRHNLGDDLFIKIITERYKDSSFSTVLLKGNDYLEKIPNLKAFRNIPLFLLLKLVERISGIRNIWLRYLAKKHDAMVYIGGSIFIDDGDMQKWEKEKQFYQSLQIPYYIVGSNFGPSKSTRFKQVVGSILGGAQDVCFRDSASYKAFSGLANVRQATDIAFSLQTSGYTIKHDKTAVVSLVDATTRFGAEKTAAYETAIRTMITELVATGYKVTLMSFCKSEGDELANARVIQGLDARTKAGVSVYNYTTNLEEALQILAASEIVIASRFHAVILGLVFAKKVLPIAYSNKTLDILNDIGFDGPVIDLRTIETLDAGSIDFAGLPITDISSQVQLAEKQFAKLDIYLGKSHE